MTHKIGIELSHKIAAIAPVVATVFGDEPTPSSPVPAIILNGKLDKSVPCEGGRPGGRFSHAWNADTIPETEAQAFFWARTNGCDMTPIVSDNNIFKRLTFNSSGGNEVISYLIKDCGHAWPGGKQGSSQGDIPSQSVNATDLMWNFFKEHRKNKISI